jgi:hypothetical protein
VGCPHGATAPRPDSVDHRRSGSLPRPSPKASAVGPSAPQCPPPAPRWRWPRWARKSTLSAGSAASANLKSTIRRPTAEAAAPQFRARCITRQRWAGRTSSTSSAASSRAGRRPTTCTNTIRRATAGDGSPPCPRRAAAGGRRVRWQDPRGRRHWLARPQHRGARGLRSWGWSVCRFHGARGGGPRGERNGMFKLGLYNARTRAYARTGGETPAPAIAPTSVSRHYKINAFCGPPRS